MGAELASAGVDGRVPNVHAVEPDGYVWCSQANTDLVASVGRGSVETPVGYVLVRQPIDSGNPSTSEGKAIP